MSLAVVHVITGVWLALLAAVLWQLSLASAADSGYALNKELTDWLVSNGGEVRCQSSSCLERFRALDFRLRVMSVALMEWPGVLPVLEA